MCNNCHCFVHFFHHSRILNSLGCSSRENGCATILARPANTSVQSGQALYCWLLILIFLKLTMDWSTFKEGKVHFTNSAVKVLILANFSKASIFWCSYFLIQQKQSFFTFFSVKLYQYWFSCQQGQHALANYFRFYIGYEMQFYNTLIDWLKQKLGLGLSILALVHFLE